MHPGQDPTETNDPASLRRQQFLEYLQQQQLLIQQREQQTSNLLTLLSQSHSAESTSWNPLLNLSSGLPAMSTSLNQTEALPDNRWNEEYMQFDQNEDELIDDVKDEEDHRPSGSASVLPLDDMPGVSEFVKKLYETLYAPRFQSVICWGPSGDSFVIKDMQECTKSVLPQLFKHSNFSSFVRQLNKYGFHKVKTTERSGQFGEHSWIFQHPDFRAGNPEALERIKRKPAAPRRNAPELSSSLPTPSSLTTSPSPFAPIVRPTLRRGSFSGPSRRLTPPARARSFVGIDSELGERLNMLEQNHEGILNEMIGLQQNLTERNDFIQNLIMRAFQGSNSNMGPLGIPTDMSANPASTSGSGSISNLPSSRLELPVQPAEVPVTTIHYYQQQQQQPGSSPSPSAATAGASFRVIRPALTFDPGNVLPFSEQPSFSTSPSTSSFTATATTTSMSTHTRSQSRSHRRYSANDVEALGSSLGLGLGVGPASSASASGSGSGLSEIPGRYAFNFNFNLGPSPGGEAAAGRSGHANDAEDENEDVNIDYPDG